MTKRRRMRSSSRLSTAWQRRFDRGGDEGFARGAFAARRAELRIEPGVEQGDDLRGDAGMLAQRRPHIVLRVRHAHLPQKARQRADHRDVAPDQPGGEHQRVVAVVFGAPAHDGEEAALETFFEHRQVQRPTQRAFERHVVEPRIRPSPAAGCDRCARRRRGSPYFPAPARARTAGSVDCGLRLSARRWRERRWHRGKARRRADARP